MRRTTALILVAAALPAVAAPLPGRAAPDLAPGARIRWVPAERPAWPVVGRAVVLTSDTLFAVRDRDSSSYALPLSSLASLEISRGRRSRSPRYALIGAAVGGVAAVAFVRIMVWTVNETIDEATGVRIHVVEWKFTNTASVALIGAGIGAACGAVIGAWRRGPEGWERVNVAGSRLGVILGTGGDPALGLTVRW